MVTRSKISKELRGRIEAVGNKRARFVLDAIVKNGMVTTEEINRAGYENPPRAVRDARELGFPIQTIKVKHSNGRSIAAYIFPEDARFGRGKGGRQALSKSQRDKIIEAAGAKCRICGGRENLQVDHRIPYEIGGEADINDPNGFMVLCGSCNRKKSWSCEHCPNWTQEREPGVCRTCYWAGEDEYIHIATEQQRRADLIWRQDEIDDYQKLHKRARLAAEAILNT